MNFFLVLLGCLGVALAAPQPKIGGRTLGDDLNDLIALIPVDDVQAIVEDHLATDGAVVAVLEYLQSDRWNGLVDEVLTLPSSMDLITYLNDAGIPVDDIITSISDYIDGASGGVDADQEGSLRPFLDEVEAILPVADLVALLNDKLQNSPDFQDLYVEISSEDGKALVDQVLQMDEAIYIQEQLTAMDVDVAGVLTTVYDFLGWGDPPTPPRV